MPPPKVIRRVVLRRLQRCAFCTAALLSNGLHADSLQLDCGFPAEPERKTR